MIWFIIVLMNVLLCVHTGMIETFCLYVAALFRTAIIELETSALVVFCNLLGGATRHGPHAAAAAACS